MTREEAFEVMLRLVPGRNETIDVSCSLRKSCFDDSPREIFYVWAGQSMGSGDSYEEAVENWKASVKDDRDKRIKELKNLLGEVS